MKECIDKAIEHIIGGKTFDENGALEKEALEMIEEKYMCDKIVTMHDLLYNSEDTGGDNKNSILLMLEDIENWKKRGYTLLATKKTAHIDNIISIGSKIYEKCSCNYPKRTGKINGTFGTKSR